MPVTLVTLSERVITVIQPGETRLLKRRNFLVGCRLVLGRQCLVRVGSFERWCAMFGVLAVVDPVTVVVVQFIVSLFLVLAGG